MNANFNGKPYPILKEITINMTVDDARAIRQDLHDLDPARINLETLGLRDLLEEVLDN
jgi:hypothetical protein